MTHVESIAVRACDDQGLLRRKARGFTLIELMVVVAVVAILAAIAYPSYQDSVRKSRRGQVKADMVEYAALAERFRTVNNAYNAPAPGFALPFTVSPRETGAAVQYNLAIVTAADTFVITATPTGGQTADRCGTLSLSQAGVKTETGTATLPECW